MTRSSAMISAARFYAMHGLPVFPLRWGRKEPLTEHGLDDATRDDRQVIDWWQHWPGANIGIATGHGVDVIDLDGWEAQVIFAEMIEQDPDLDQLIIGAVMTPR